MPELKVLPYSPSYLNSTFKRVVVKPIPKDELINEGGLIIPTDVGRICERGIVFAVDKDSAIKEGDTVLYHKMDRTSPEHIDIISYEDNLYDVLYENELWAVNDMPFNKIFVTPTSDIQVNGDGLMLADGAKSVTQKGVVFRADPEYSVKEGDNVEYRKPEQDIYPTIEIQGNVYDVLNETDIFIVNGVVAPHRIIVKIDLIAQQAKRTSTDQGLLRSQLFLYMKFNLQYAEVVEIGKEARKLYPGLKVGDTAILHHTVEEKTQNYRIVKRDISKYNIPLYEYRVINAYDTSNRELMGRIANRDKMIIVPYGNHEFLDWEFDLLAAQGRKSELFTDFATNLDRCHDLEDFTDTAGKKKKEYIDKSMAKIRGVKKHLSTLDPLTNKNEFDRFETMFKEAQVDGMKIANYLNANHLVICKRSDNGERIVVPYKELYPINILGKRYLIAWKDYIVAKIVGTED